MTIFEPAFLLQATIYCLLTLGIYRIFFTLQNKLKAIWFNPMLLSISVIIPLLLSQQISYQDYYQATQIYTYLLEPAIVALGFPLYQQLNTIKHELKQITAIIVISITLAIVSTYFIALVTVMRSDIAVSLSLKAVTTPIALVISEQYQGLSSITAVGIMFAGLFGALLGPKWLSLLGINSARAQGLAIGCASHALGTAEITKKSLTHGAYSSLSLILTAFFTAIIAPLAFSMMM